ncbi:MAG: AAA family ATPase [Gemmatimonadetes bacterium]|nr:AAA family ATPase [Gemmatimonadota bacterium]
MIHLHSIARRDGEAPHRFPFTVPVVRELARLSFTTPVTFFVGENGSGKSTVLEAIAAAAALPTVGARDTRRDPTLAAQRELADALRLSWERKATRGFFLRAEDFFGFTRSLAKMRAELLAELDDVAVSYAGASPKARELREGPIRASLGEMERRYGTDLDANSHGQSFLTLFRARFVPGGLYLLDEPEAPLSPQSQLGLMAMMKDMVAQDAQFIIATHSPILLAFPGATIYSFDQSPVAAVSYDSLEHVNLTRDFLAAPDRFLRHL